MLTAPGQPVALRDGELLLLLASPRDAGPLLDRCEAALAPGERERRARSLAAGHRDLFTLARGMLRIGLARVAPREPESWDIVSTPKGRPELSPAQFEEWPLRFSVTHTEGLAAVAIGLARDVGVDAESIHRAADIAALARRWFTPGEAAALEVLTGVERRERFFALWTLKEAWAKAKGIDLAVASRSTLFEVGTGNAAALTAAPPDDHPSAWWFTRLRPTSDHRLALAVRADGTAVEVTSEWMTRAP